ncbi:Mak32 [Kluyveromyces lactis]|nr:Mak32 [Kluyveromyces lactis]
MGLLTTNGMLIIDEIETVSSHYYDVLGGGGTYAMLGASICCTDLSLRKELLWIVDRGMDFPKQLTETIESWDTGCVFRDDKRRLTTRGYNVYGANDFRSFKYLAPKKRIDVSDWCESFGVKAVQRVSCYHLLCSAERVADILDKLAEELSFEGTLKTGQTFIWEPIPDLCSVEYLEEIKNLLNGPYHFIFSPNAEEGARMLGETEPTELTDCSTILLKLAALIKPGNICVLRCGKEGSLALICNKNPSNDDIIHFPAYHYKTPECVIDPTGGGNTFLGAFAFAYAMCKDISIASICGNIAAGCAIEQIGVPSHNGMHWNKTTFADRLLYYLSTYELKQGHGEILTSLQPMKD